MTGTAKVYVVKQGEDGRPVRVVQSPPAPSKARRVRLRADEDYRIKNLRIMAAHLRHMGDTVGPTPWDRRIGRALLLAAAYLDAQAAAIGYIGLAWRVGALPEAVRLPYAATEGEPPVAGAPAPPIATVESGV